MNNQPIETKQQSKPIYYWLDGYWITDKEEAELMDEINAFGSTHGVINVSSSADEDSIEKIIKEALSSENVTDEADSTKLNQHAITAANN